MGIQAETGIKWKSTQVQSLHCGEGFQQKKGVNFDEIFVPIVKMTSISIMLSIAANMHLEIEQLDVKTTFLHRNLEEEIYMQQPEEFEVKGKENLVCRLRKSFYQLKQVPRHGTRSLNPSWWTKNSTKHKYYIVTDKFVPAKILDCGCFSYF